MKSKIATILALLAAVSCGSNEGKTEQAAPVAVTPNVEVAVAQARAVPQESTYASTVEAYVVNNIMPQQGGRIRKINVEVGDYVSKGQILAEMDRLQLDQLALQIQNDDAEYARIKSLYEEGGLSRSDFEAAELGYKVRKSNYQNVEENTILRSPVTGYVTARNFDVGDMFAMSAPLFTVVVDNQNKVLRPGMYARVTVNFGSRSSVVVPDQALVKQEGTGTRFIFVLQEDGTVKYLPVKTGRHMGAEYEILEGLQDGWKVVVKGQAALRDGVKVNVL